MASLTRSKSEMASSINSATGSLTGSLTGIFKCGDSFVGDPNFCCSDGKTVK